MTVLIQLSDEKTAVLAARAHAQGLSVQQYVQQVLEQDLESEAKPRRHISEVIEEIMSDVPMEVFERLPKDGASEHDHYLYGSPKKNQ